MSQGIIVKGIGGFYYVDIGDKIVECRARGKFRIKEGKPIIGDKVDIDLLADDTGYIKTLYPRKNELIRPPVCNIDVLVIVISMANPKTDLFLIDKVIAIAEHKEMDVIICINKCDVDSGDDMYNIYTNAGFTVIRTSAETGHGIDELLDKLAAKVSAFCGNSGVGKSSILNKLDENLFAETGEISEKIGRGKHTTRHVELFKLSNGGFIADTPGFSSFETERMDLVFKDDLQYCFRDFKEYIGDCKFTSCAHVKEKGCAVIDAVQSDKIASSRHESYVKLFESVKDIKEWEQKK